MSDYIFPQKFANWMGKVSQRTQYEASMLSLTFILFGLIFFAVYTIFYTDSGFWFKFMWTINSICGFIFLGSYLVTSYQQYKSYKEVMGLYKKENEEEVIDYVG